jgi:IclR family pca regulon transcriptional regulator
MAELSKTVDQSLAVLLSLSAEGPASASELARRIGVNRTVCHRLLATLERRRFARRAADGTWRLGVTLLELADRVGDDVRVAARPVLDELAQGFGETVVLSVPDGLDVVAIDRALGDRHPVRVDYHPGRRHPQTRGAHGRAVLAFAEEDRVAQALADDERADEIRTLLAETRTRGYAISHDELQLGAAGLAAPVCDRRGVVIASLGMVAPAGRLPAEEVVAPELVGGARRIAEHLDGAPSLEEPDGDRRPPAEPVTEPQPTQEHA